MHTRTLCSTATTLQSGQTTRTITRAVRCPGRHGSTCFGRTNVHYRSGPTDQRTMAHATPPSLLSSSSALFNASHPAIPLYPAAAILVDTDHSTRVSLSYCVSTVQRAVQDRLRSLLVERLLTPQVLADMRRETEGAGEEKSKQAGQASSSCAVAYDATATVAHMATGVQRALHATRRVAFSTMSPRLQHESWHPLWSAYREHLLTQESKSEHVRKGAEELGGFMTVCAETMRPVLRDVSPFFGAATSGIFFSASPSTAATTPCDGAATGDSAPRVGDREPEVSHTLSAEKQSSSLPHLKLSAPPSNWECFRVDSYIPSSEQMQAAVRHLLRERRPIADGTHVSESVDRPHTVRRPLAVIALVVPDHLVDPYAGFVHALENDYAALRGRDTSSASWWPVQLHVFNSTQLVRVSLAV